MFFLLFHCVRLQRMKFFVSIFPTLKNIYTATYPLIFNVFFNSTNFAAVYRGRFLKH